MSLVWRFRSSPPLAARVVRELLNQSHTSKACDSSVPYEPEVRKRDCRKVCANFGFGTLANLTQLIRSLALITPAALLGPAPSFALDDPPAKPRIDCTKPANKNKPACKPSNGQLSDDEIYNAAYWLAHEGKYAQAFVLLGHARNKSDPRILNETGYVTRKLGDVDGALPYYQKALAINPDYTLAREYMGEAFLDKGDFESAREQLAEIEKRCGTRCVEYAKLAGAIAALEAAGPRGG